MKAIHRVYTVKEARLWWQKLVIDIAEAEIANELKAARGLIAMGEVRLAQTDCLVAVQRIAQKTVKNLAL